MLHKAPPGEGSTPRRLHLHSISEAPAIMENQRVPPCFCLSVPPPLPNLPLHLPACFFRGRPNQKAGLSLSPRFPPSLSPGALVRASWPGEVPLTSPPPPCKRKLGARSPSTNLCHPRLIMETRGDSPFSSPPRLFKEDHHHHHQSCSQPTRSAVSSTCTPVSVSTSATIPQPTHRHKGSPF